jgi:hypothetical protein
VKPTARRNGESSVSWLPGSSILWLKEVDIAAAGNIEGMAFLAHNPSFFTNQGQPAFPNCTDQH